MNLPPSPTNDAISSSTVRKGSAGGRPPDFDKEIYRRRNVVERCFNRLKGWRDLVTRFAKRASI